MVVSQPLGQPLKWIMLLKLISCVLNLATLSIPQVSTQSKADSDYIIQNILEMDSYYII